MEDASRVSSQSSQIFYQLLNLVLSNVEPIEAKFRYD